MLVFERACCSVFQRLSLRSACAKSVVVACRNANRCVVNGAAADVFLGLAVPVPRWPAEFHSSLH